MDANLQPITWLRTGAAKVLIAVLPPLCLSCDQSLNDQGLLCAAYWSKVGFIAPPFYSCCGFPFPYDPGEAALCADCSREAPAYDRGRAVMRYDALSRRLVLGFKYGDRTEAAAPFAAWMARAGAELIGQADLLAVVPLHWTRLFKRRYNQAALLAAVLAGEREGLLYCPELLQRRRATPSQGRLSRSARARNVRGAFRANPAWLAALRGRRILLIDDVLTTGATLEACARVLRRAGAANIDVLVLARVVRGEK